MVQGETEEAGKLQVQMFLKCEGDLAYTCSLLVSGRRCWAIHRGGWPQGRGSARTLVAGGLPLSDEDRSMFTYLQKQF